MSPGNSRRNFIRKTALGTAAAAGIGQPAFAFIRDYKKQAPSDRLNIAFVGVGGRGFQNLKLTMELGDNCVALCDVDWGKRSREAFDLFPDAARYKDFRKMLDKQLDIDAVVISTPDHTHAVVAMPSIKLGYHVYCEKPLAHSVFETRQITETAKEYGVQTQLGNQGHSLENVRRLVEWIEDGAIGDVREVHAWCDRPRPKTWFPSGIKRPEDTPDIPDSLEWDLWIGPAPYRPFHPLYHPGYWRGWVDFGCGAVGDMGCHILDPAFWSLNLGSPTTVEASTTTMLEEINRESFPMASVIRWEFPERDGKPPVNMTWHDGGLLPKLPPGIDSLEEIGPNGAMLIGEKGILVHKSHGADGLRMLPDEKMNTYKEPPITIPRVSGHHSDWVEACKTGKPASGNFNYGGPLTEMVLLGSIAGRIKDRKLNWDADNMKFTNSEEANALLKTDYREGWSL
ncbi:Gfo/Idh/MocA family protein [Bacteroidota bacterium]